MGERMAFIGGGNMAGAIIGGLISQGTPASEIDVVEPYADAQAQLKALYGITAQAQPGAVLTQASVCLLYTSPSPRD